MKRTLAQRYGNYSVNPSPMEPSTSLTKTLSLIGSGLLDVLYPPHCLLCRVRLAEGSLCQACLHEMQGQSTPKACERCGAGIERAGNLCEDCWEERYPAFDWAFGVGNYSGKLREAIHLLKYKERLALAEPLGSLIANTLAPSCIQKIPLTDTGQLRFDKVVPVPLHPSRYRLRGFNQSERLARVVAQQRGWQLDTKSLLRIRATHSQATLNETDRKSNVVGAFAVRPPLCFEGLSVLLIDDVLTTTATVGECARVLKEAGATAVCVVGLARGW